MSKLDIKVVQTTDEEQLLPSLMAISVKYATVFPEKEDAARKAGIRKEGVSSAASDDQDTASSSNKA